VHGRDEVVVAAEEFRRLKGDLTGAALVAALQASPYRDIDLEPRRERLPVRDVKLSPAGCSTPISSDFRPYLIRALTHWRDWLRESLQNF
jgi:hypothetical protein